MIFGLSARAEEAPETTKRRNLVISACNRSFSNLILLSADVEKPAGDGMRIGASSLAPSELRGERGEVESTVWREFFYYESAV